MRSKHFSERVAIVLSILIRGTLACAIECIEYVVLVWYMHALRDRGAMGQT